MLPHLPLALFLGLPVDSAWDAKHLEAMHTCSKRGHLQRVTPLAVGPVCEKALPEGWRYQHVYKAGGTSVESTFGGHVRNCSSAYHSVFATVRSPVSHWLSGYHEAMMRLKRGGYLNRSGPYHESHPLYRLAIADMDRLERVRATLDYLQQRPEQLKQRAYAEFHFEPAVRSLITKEANGTHRILPGLAVVIEISQVGGLFNVTLAHSRSARGYPEFSAKEPELSETQMVQLCNFMIVDYCCLSYQLPDVCARYFGSPASWALRAYAPDKAALWACARENAAGMR